MNNPPSPNQPQTPQTPGNNQGEKAPKRKRWRLPLLPSLVVFCLFYWAFILYLEYNAKREIEKTFAGLLTCSSVDIQVFNGIVVFNGLVFNSPLENTPPVPMAVIKQLRLTNLWSSSFSGNQSVEFESASTEINLVKTADGRLNISEFDRFIDKLEEEKDKDKSKDKDKDKDDKTDDEEDVYTIGSLVVKDVQIRLWRQTEDSSWSTTLLTWDRLSMQNITTDAENKNPTALQFTNFILDFEGKQSADNSQAASAPPADGLQIPLLQIPAVQAKLKLAVENNQPNHVESLRIYNPQITLNATEKPFAHKELAAFLQDYFDEPEEFLSKKQQKQLAKAKSAAKKNTEAKSTEGASPISEKPEARFNDVQLINGLVRLNAETPREFTNIQATVNWLPGNEKQLKLSASTPELKRALSLELNSQGSPWTGEDGLLSGNLKCREFPLVEVLDVAELQRTKPNFPLLKAGLLTLYFSFEITPTAGSGTFEIEMNKIQLTPDRRPLLERFQPAGVAGVVQSLLPSSNSQQIPNTKAEFSTTWDDPSLLVLYAEFTKALQLARASAAMSDSK
ncbi:MAG: hypothetical protein ACFCU1_00095 [Sumerlaeia bacterium]